MNARIVEILKNEGIELFSAIPLESNDFIRPDKLKRYGLSSKGALFAVMIAIPYLTRQAKRNLSAYAVSKDYHGYFEGLFSRIVPALSSAYPEYTFAGFADNSPIDERYAAAAAGLGIIGDNGLLITEKYSSYVFLGEIITDMPIECERKEIEHCRGCGVCKRECPMKDGGGCLSAITQKKGELSEDERRAIAEYGSVWGCDRCQELCPHTLRAIKAQTIYTNVDYFTEDTEPLLTLEKLDTMSDENFALRAYSWRGRETVRRNLTILKK